jgi:hypothetical protein
MYLTRPATVLSSGAKAVFFMAPQCIELIDKLRL